MIGKFFKLYILLAFNENICIVFFSIFSTSTNRFEIKNLHVLIIDLKFVIKFLYENVSLHWLRQIFLYYKLKEQFASHLKIKKYNNIEIVVKF